MAREFLGRPRRAVLPHVPGARAHDAANLADTNRDEAAVRQRADTDRQVQVIVDQIERSVGQHQAHIDLRKGLQEIGRHRQDMQAAEDHRRAQDEFTSRRVVLPRRAALRFGDLLENALAGGDIGPTRLGQDQLARRTHQQPRSDVRFEFRELAADGRQRHSQLAAGG